MHIRRAGDGDLEALAHVFVTTAGELVARYRPEQAEALPLVPGERLPLYRHLLATGAIFMAEDPEPVGFAGAVIRDGVWFLSQLWVLPERQTSGIGSAILDESLAWGEGSSTFSTIASPYPGAQVVYMRHSMFPSWVLLDFQGDPGRPDLPEGMAPLTEDDQGWVDDLDRETRGFARPEDHAWFRRGGTAMTLRREGAPAGYVYAWPNGKIGPAAAREPGDLPILVRAGLHLAGRPIALPVPSTNWIVLNECVRLGLQLTGSSTFMSSRPLPDASRTITSGGALG